MIKKEYEVPYSRMAKTTLRSSLLVASLNSAQQNAGVPNDTPPVSKDPLDPKEGYDARVRTNSID